MKKIFILIFFLLYSLSSNAHMEHYNKFDKIEMEILRDGEIIGYNYYFFKRDGNKTTVTNQIKFTVKLFGATIFEIEGYAIQLNFVATRTGVAFSEVAGA